MGASARLQIGGRGDIALEGEGELGKRREGRSENRIPRFVVCLELFGSVGSMASFGCFALPDRYLFEFTRHNPLPPRAARCLYGPNQHYIIFFMYAVCIRISQV